MSNSASAAATCVPIEPLSRKIVTREMQSQPTDPRKFLFWILEPALAANLAFACVCASLAHIANNEARINSLDDSLYVFLRAVFRIADLLHIPFSNPVTTAGVGRNFDYSSKVSFAEEVCVVILTGVRSIAISPPAKFTSNLSQRRLPRVVRRRNRSLRNAHAEPGCHDSR
jgi:hypothetical protein